MTVRSIAETFTRLREQGRAALVPYVTAGHPRHDATVEVMAAVAGAGADIIELGIPFSDPLADGPTIQLSSYQSLSGGTTTQRVLSDLSRFRRDHDTPVVLFTYLNPVLRFGIDAFLAEAVAVGAQGLLLTDLPTGADPDTEARVRDSGLDLVRLVAPTTPLERVREVAASGSGFLYYISRTGVTGAQASLRSELAREVGRVRDAVALPVAVGFGISTPEQAARVASLADGVVVGSALVRTLAETGIGAGAAFVASLRRGMDAGRAGPT